MSDKDLLVVISEMLRKQDQQAEKLDVHSKILNEHTDILNHQSEILTETNSTLKQFVDISIRQFEQQQLFNEQFNIQFERQNQFNERFLNKLEDIEKALKK